MALSGWGTFLGSVAGPIAKKVFAALGIGTITIVGLQAAINSGIAAASASLGGMTGVVADLVAMSGFFSAASILAGAVTASVSVVMLQRFAKLT
jgi:hypothetical protein